MTAAAEGDEVVGLAWPASFDVVDGEVEGGAAASALVAVPVLYVASHVLPLAFVELGPAGGSSVAVGVSALGAGVAVASRAHGHAGLSTTPNASLCQRSSQLVRVPPQ